MQFSKAPLSLLAVSREKTDGALEKQLLLGEGARGRDIQVEQKRVDLLYVEAVDSRQVAWKALDERVCMDRVQRGKVLILLLGCGGVGQAGLVILLPAVVRELVEGRV